MTAEEITESLEAIASSENFVGSCYQLVERWESTSVGAEALEPIIRFIEQHPEIDHGIPGPLVHFLEGVCERGDYARALLQSLQRRPAYETIMMLGRFCLGAELDDLRRYIAAIERVSQDPRAGEDVLTAARHFLDKAVVAGRMNYYPGF